MDREEWLRFFAQDKGERYDTLEAWLWEHSEWIDAMLKERSAMPPYSYETVREYFRGGRAGGE